VTDLLVTNSTTKFEPLLKLFRVSAGHQAFDRLFSVDLVSRVKKNSLEHISETNGLETTFDPKTAVWSLESGHGVDQQVRWQRESGGFAQQLAASSVPFCCAKPGVATSAKHSEHD